MVKGYKSLLVQLSPFKELYRGEAELMCSSTNTGYFWYIAGQGCVGMQEWLLPLAALLSSLPLLNLILEFSCTHLLF